MRKIDAYRMIIRTCNTIAAFALVFTVGCGSSHDAYRQEVNGVLAAARMEPRQVGAPSQLVSQPWKVGQWALYKTTEHGEPGYRRTSVVTRGACGFWLEIVNQTAKRRLAAKMCFRTLVSSDSALASGIGEIQLMVVRVDDQEPQAFDFRKGANSRAREVLQSLLARVESARWGAADAAREDIVVPAGHFAKTVRITETFSVNGGTVEVSEWRHPAVPLVGTVRVSTSDGDEAVLVDYGQDGARTTLPNVPGG